jgi:hypothetical protein
MKSTGPLGFAGLLKSPPIGGLISSTGKKGFFQKSSHEN